MPHSQSERPKQMFPPNGVMTPTAVAERIPNGLSGSMIHRQRLITEGIRGSPRFAMTATPPKEEIAPVQVPPEQKDQIDEQVAEILADENTDVSKEKSLSIANEEPPPIPGVVPQEAA